MVQQEEFLSRRSFYAMRAVCLVSSQSVRGYRMKSRCNLVPAKISPRGTFSKELTDSTLARHSMYPLVRSYGRGIGEESTGNRHERELIWRTCGGTSSSSSSSWGNPGAYTRLDRRSFSVVASIRGAWTR